MDQVEVFRRLSVGDITFTEAAEELGISKNQVEILFEEYEWLPSPERIATLCEEEKNSIERLHQIALSNTLQIVRRYQSPISYQIIEDSYFEMESSDNQDSGTSSHSSCIARITKSVSVDGSIYQYNIS